MTDTRRHLQVESQRRIGDALPVPQGPEAPPADCRASPIRVWLMFFTLLAILLWPWSSFAQEMSLRNLVVDSQEGSIVLRFGMSIEDPMKLARLLEDGEVVGMTCEANLKKQRTLWPDKILAESRLVFFLRYDILAKQYVMELQDGKKSFRNEDFRILISQAWQEISMRLGSWRILDKDQSYSVGLEISMDRVEVPVWLRKALFFWPWDVVPVTRYQLDFTY